MRHLGISLSIAVFAALIVAACGGAPTETAPPTTAAPAAAPAALTPGDAYVCPMHPEVTAGAPGKCPKCEMDLVPKTAGDTGAAAGAGAGSASGGCTCKASEPDCKCGHCSTGQGACECGGDHDVH